MAQHQEGINALFVLSCGCILDGCHDSDPGHKFAENGPGGRMICTQNEREHGDVTLTDVVSLDPLEALPSEPQAPGG